MLEKLWIEEAVNGFVVTAFLKGRVHREIVEGTKEDAMRVAAALVTEARQVVQSEMKEAVNA